MILIESFFWGILAALGALVVEIVFYVFVSPFVDPAGAMPFSQFFIIPNFIIVAAFIEEILKYILISKRFSVLSPEKLRFANALLIGLGFFLIELMFILATKVSPAPQFLIEIAIVHIGTAGLIGGILAIKNARKFATFVYVIAVAVTFHSAYNLLSLKRNGLNNYLIFFILGLLIVTNLAIFLYTRRNSRQIFA